MIHVSGWSHDPLCWVIAVLDINKSDSFYKKVIGTCGKGRRATNQRVKTDHVSCQNRLYKPSATFEDQLHSMHWKNPVRIFVSKKLKLWRKNRPSKRIFSQVNKIFAVYVLVSSMRRNIGRAFSKTWKRKQNCNYQSMNAPIAALKRQSTTHSLYANLQANSI